MGNLIQNDLCCVSSHVSWILFTYSNHRHLALHQSNIIFISSVWVIGTSRCWWCGCPNNRTLDRRERSTWSAGLPVLRRYVRYASHCTSRRATSTGSGLILVTHCPFWTHCWVLVSVRGESWVVSSDQTYGCRGKSRWNITLRWRAWRGRGCTCHLG